MASPALKRSVEGEHYAQKAIEVLPAPSRDESHDSHRATSPLSSVRSLTPKPGTPAQPNTAMASEPPAKRRKLTPAEKETQKIEKEKQQQEKAAQKAQKEEEKRAKLEEKKAKDEEKEEKRRVKDAEKAAKDQERKEKQDKKDAEKKAKDDEKAKKERAQMRLTGFFGKPKSGSPQAISPPSSRRGSIAPEEDAETLQQTPARIAKSVLFLPFEPPSYSIVAPYNRFSRDSPALDFSLQQMDDFMRGKSQAQKWDTHDRKRVLDEAFQPPVKRRRYIGPTSVKNVIESIQGSQDQPIDLTSSTKPHFSSPLDVLRSIPVKQFKYKEDVRPPYIGTYTKVPSGRSIKSLSRKPFERALPKIDYDYDSEAEWEEPEEGEDLVSEGEEEGDNEDVGEMDDFLDDEDTESNARRRQVVDVPPLQTDIHWEMGKRTSNSDTVSMGDGALDLQMFRIETLIEESVFSIDPFSAAYWQPLPTSTAQDSSSSNSSMAPPRLPLSSNPSAANIPITPGTHPSAPPLSPSSAAKIDQTQPKWNAFPGTAVMNPGKSKAGRPASQPLPPELMESFKAAIVQDKEMTKVGLVEVLKKKFPSVPKVTLTDTLERVAARVGERQVDKRWELRV